MTKELRDIDVSGIYFVADERAYFAEVSFSISEPLDTAAGADGYGVLPPVFTVTVNVQITGEGSEVFAEVRDALIQEGKSLLRLAVADGDTLR